MQHEYEIPSKVISYLRKNFIRSFSLSRFERFSPKRGNPTLDGANGGLARNFFPLCSFLKNRATELQKNSSLSFRTALSVLSENKRPLRGINPGALLERDQAVDKSRLFFPLSLKVLKSGKAYARISPRGVSK